MDWDTYSIDDWTGDSDEGWCYTCQDWVTTKEDDKECCSTCGNHLDGVVGDEFAHPTTAKTAISPAPTVYGSGDVWGRTGSGFTWGSGTSWWSGGSTSLSGMWGSSSYSHTDKAKRLAKHKSHLDSLCKVVDPTVPHKLSFADHSSGYSDIKRGRIVVDGKLIEDDDDKLDVVSGLAIHEKLHLIHTAPLLKWEREYSYDNCKNGAENWLLHTVCNIIEDEYIERQLATTCGGFVQYIEKCKEHYFQSSDIEEEVKEPLADVINTLMMLVRFPTLIDDDRKKRHAPHIRFFARALTTGINSREDTYTCIESIYNYLKATAEKMKGDEDVDMDKVMEEVNANYKDMKERFAESDVEMTDEEMAQIFERMVANATKAEEDRIKSKSPITDARMEVSDIVNKLTEYASKGLDSDLIKEMNELIESDFEELELDKALTISGQSKINWQVAKDTDMTRDRYRETIDRMKPVIGQLKRKIQLYGNLNTYTVRNQKVGKLDKRMLHRIPQKRTDLFKFDISQQDKPLDVCLLVDESGSMGYHTMQQARDASIAVKEALKDNDQLNLWVFGHSADEAGKGDTDMIEYHSPRITDRPTAMGGMHARYENRDGNAIITSADRVVAQTEQPQSHKLMIVFSDGQPSADGYRGATGLAHTKKAVKHIEGKGWSVIQLGFAGASEWSMKECFTNWKYINDSSKLPIELTKLIRKVLKI